MLGPLATAGRSRFATFLLPEGSRTFRVAALRGVAADPLVRGPVGTRYINERFADETQPRAHHAADALDLGEVLGAERAALRDRGGGAGAHHPTPAGAGRFSTTPPTTPHRARTSWRTSGSMATALSASLELGSALEATREAERLRAAALLGAAGLRTNDEVLDTLVGAARRPGRAPQGRGVRERSARRSAGSRCRWPARSRGPAGSRRWRWERPCARCSRSRRCWRTSRTRTPTCGLRVPPRRWPAIPTLLRLGLLAMLSAAGGRQVEARVDNSSVKIRVGPVQQPPPAAAAGDFTQSVYLALAQKVADIHGGSVEARARRARTFLTLTLPRH